MRHHVEHRPGLTLGGESKDSDDDETKVRNRCVRDQAHDVRLANRHERSVNDGDDRQNANGEGERARSIWEQLQAVTDHAEGADLVHQGDQHHGSARRGLRSSVGQPSVQRPQGCLDGKGQEESQEEPVLQSGVDLQRAQRLEVKGSVAQEGLARHIQPDEGREHDQSTKEAVEQELHRRVRTLGATKTTDQQVRGDQHCFEEQVEQEHVQCRKDPNDHRLQNEHESEVTLDRSRWLDIAPRSDQDNRHQTRCQGDKN